MQQQKSTDMLGEWLVILSTSLCLFYSFFQLNFLNSISSELMQTFSLSLVQMGMFSSVSFYTAAVFLLPAGILFDRFSVRNIILLCMSINIFGTLLFATTHIVYIALLSRFIVGMCQALAFVGCIRIATSWAPKNHTTLAIGITFSIGLIAGILAQTPFVLLTQLVGWRNSLLIVVLVGVACFLPILKFTQEHPKKTLTGKQSSREFWQNVFGAVKNKNNWLLGLYAGVIASPATLFAAAWGNLYLYHSRGIEANEASISTSLVLFGIVCGSPLLSYIADRAKNKLNIMLYGAILLVLTVMPIIWLIRLPVIAIFLLFFIVGMLAGLQSIAFSCVAATRTEQAGNTAVSITLGIFEITCAIVMSLFGVFVKHGWFIWAVATKHLTQLAAHYQNALVLLLLTSIFGLLIVMRLKEKPTQV